MKSQIEQLADGLTLERLDEGQILIFKIDSMSQATLRTLFSTVEEIQRKMPNDTPYLAMYDATQNLSASVTPTVRKVASEVARKKPLQSGRNALVVSSLFSMLISPLKLFFKRDLQRIQKKILWEVFSNREAALAWLREGLPKE